MDAERKQAWLIGALVSLVGLGVLLPGLGGHGIWSVGEMQVLDRARAELGEALSGLERNPWLPDRVRAWSYGAFGGELGLRLPQAIAAALVAGIAAGWSRLRGCRPSIAMAAGAVALSFPAVAVAGRLALGNPIGELLGVVTVLLGTAALRHRSRSRALAFGATTGLVLAGSVASSGLLLGGAVPLAAIALAEHVEPNRSRVVLAALWSAVAIAVGIAIGLALGQGDGYIPLLGAAKDLELVDKPEHRRFAAILEDFGHQTFPWGVFAALGIVTDRGRWPTMWCVAGLCLAGGWSLLYGSLDLPLAVPTAMAVAATLEHLVAPERAILARRLIVFVALGGMLVVRKDAELVPSRVLVPQYEFLGEFAFPAERFAAGERMKRIAGIAVLALLFAGVVARRRDEARGRIARALDRIPDRLRDEAAVIGFVGAGLYGAIAFTHGLVPDASRLMSLREPLLRYREWAEAGELPQPLAVHRVRDDGLAYYAPAELEPIENRRLIGEYLQSESPKVVLIRDIDLPWAHQQHHLLGWPMYVLDNSHAQVRLVANVLPPGAEDRNTIPTVLFREPPALANETLLRFENYVEVIGWEVDGPIVRGRKHRLRLALRVLRPLPGGSKIYARFLKDRLSRINGEPQEIAGGLYPSQLWREGDYILHEFEFEAPPLEILPGMHDFVIGLRRSETANYTISEPAEESGAFGVQVRGTKRNFAKIGEVQVW